MVCYKKGNVLIVVLLMTALASVVAIMSLKSILWAQDFTHAAFAHEGRICIAQGLLRCALERGARDFDDLCKKAIVVKSSLEVDGYIFTLVLEPKKDKIYASCSICQHDKRIGILSAELVRNEHKKLQIRDFQR